MAYGPTSPLGGKDLLLLDLYSGPLISLLFGLNDFAKSDIRFHDHIHLEICIMPFLNWESGSTSLCSQATWSFYQGHPASSPVDSLL